MAWTVAFGDPGFHLDSMLIVKEIKDTICREQPGIAFANWVWYLPNIWFIVSPHFLNMSEKNVGLFSQLCPPKPTWTSAEVPDQTGKTVIVTGGNGGIGKETARVLLSRGARVYIATRSEEKSQKAIEELKKETGKDSIFFLKLDLADLVSVKAAAEEYIEKETELHTLYNNGGVYAVIDKETAQGFDMQFGTNVLGHFFFTKLLLPVLTATAKKTPAGTVRV
ncbi:hypothetical protein V8E53_015491, partial [Lactarius tabidus]